FFFSSRRRHTRWPRDWSSDVCSSDLADADRVPLRHMLRAELNRVGHEPDRRLGRKDKFVLGVELLEDVVLDGAAEVPPVHALVRSEERRVGKEWRCRWVVWA